MSSSNFIGQPFIELLTVESTNNYAMGLARAGMAQHGTVVFAHDQTKGKGQRTKEWLSQRGQNIAMSVIIEPGNLQLSEIFSLSMMAAISVFDFFERQVTGEITIKWPNDIYWRDRKAAGILIENLWQGAEWKLAVVGIGINVNQTDFGELCSRAVSLKEITGKRFEPVALARNLCEILETNYRLLVSNPLIVIDQYKKHLYKINQRVTLKKGNRVFEAEFRDVNNSGQMIVQHALEEKFNVGEVEWLINGE